MERTIKFAIAVVLSLGFQTAFAQSSIDRDFAGLEEVTESLLKIEDKIQLSIVSNNEEKLLFIDFQKTPFNLNDITIRHIDGTVLYKDQLWDLPVDSIYEVDLKQFGKETIEIEVRSFKETLVRRINLS